MLKAIILLGVTCPAAWALPTAHTQTTLSSDAHDQKTLSSYTHDKKTLGQKTLSSDTHDQIHWTESESETALLNARRKRFNIIAGCDCQHGAWSAWSADCDQLANCGETVTRTRAKKWCAKYKDPDSWCVG